MSDNVTREERLLEGILNGETETNIEPATRKEILLAGILNGERETNVDPATREEALLKEILLNGGGGGGVDPSDATATAEDIKHGRTAYTAAGKVTGTAKLEEEAYDDLLSEEWGTDSPPLPSDLGQIHTGKESDMTFRQVTNTSFELRRAWGDNIGAYAYWQVDLTDLSSIKLGFKTYSFYGAEWELALGITDEPSLYPVYVGEPVKTLNIGDVTLEIDVSELTGTHYVICEAHGWNLDLLGIVIH